MTEIIPFHGLLHAGSGAAMREASLRRRRREWFASTRTVLPLRSQAGIYFRRTTDGESAHDSSSDAARRDSRDSRGHAGSAPVALLPSVLLRQTEIGEGGPNDMSVQSPATIIPYPESVPQEFDARRELARDRARKILSHEYKVFEAKIGGAYGLDLSTFRCALCGGRFAELGYCWFWYEEEPMVVAHRACAKDDVEAWADDGTDGAA